MSTLSAPEQFALLLAEAKKLEVYGANAVVRRLLSLIEMFGSHEGLTQAQSAPLRRPCDEDYPRGPVFHTAANEVLQEYSRRSIMLNPVEAASTHMAEFLMGRLQAVEFRDEDLKVDYAEVDKKATLLMKGKVPLISVNHRLAESPDEIVAALRVLADQIACDASQFSFEAVRPHVGDLVTYAGECNLERTETLATRWSNNGRLYEQQIRGVFRCVTRDLCCGNKSYHTEYGNPRWETVWQEAGDPTQRPPVTPPSFESAPWANRLPVISDPTVGTLTSDWGWRNVNGSSDFHGGIDVGVPAGTAVQSHVRGTIVQIVTSTNQEQGVVIRGFSNETYTYWHIVPATGLREGASVLPGAALGAAYDWGSRTHLHYAEHTPPNGDPALRSDANSRNPLP